MYTDSERRPLDIGEMDTKLTPFGFVRQYCEDNMTPGLRELNCLYTRRGREPVWVTGRPLPQTKSGQAALAVQYDTAKRPRWPRQVVYVAPLHTASTPGALDGVLTPGSKRRETAS